MSGSPGIADPEVVDYGRFAERLAAVREATAADSGRRWDLYREFQAEWGYVPSALEPKAHEDYILDLVGAEPTDDPEDDPGIPRALAEWWILPGNSMHDRGDLYSNSALVAFGRTRSAIEDLVARLGGDWEIEEPVSRAAENDQ